MSAFAEFAGYSIAAGVTIYSVCVFFMWLLPCRIAGTDYEEPIGRDE